MASSDRRNVASLSHLSVSPSPADAARPEKGERSLPSSPYILNADVDSLRALLLDALEGISFLTDQVAALRDENAQLRREHKHDAQQQATTLNNIQAELRSFRQEPRQGGKQPPSSYAAATSLQDPVDLMRDERGNTRPVTKATCAPGAAVPAAIGGARSVASILDSRMHPRHQDKLNLDGGGFHKTRPKLPRTRRPLLKGSASASGISVAPPPSQPRRQRAVFVTRLGPNCDAASLQAHIEQSGTLSELACTRLKTRHDGYSSFHVTAAEQDIEKLFDPLLWPEGSLFKEFTGQLTESRIYEAVSQSLPSSGNADENT
ncbi:hypothetical protein HPB47_015864 [Ixodes persulcatus]|uniref:Uncharacterized protein n=1 Tax=Ixodes persulcatus TaxID=34615 RepID=A0AC60QTK2_IXOPE|nr:hypothetical protein HPB47_015864 [Ixodes persulcatus]